MVSTLAAGAADQDDPGGSVMSSQMNDLSTIEHERDDARHKGDLPVEHPRSAGFRVLSRLARKRAEELPDYAPRHRMTGEQDALTAVG